MRKSHSVFLIALVALTLSTALLAADATNSLPAGVVNINTADVAQLSNLPRVGKAAAQRIIDYRTEHGPFAKTSDLMQIKGFGTYAWLGVV
jgi:competence protein ComEA